MPTMKRGHFVNVFEIALSPIVFAGLLFGLAASVGCGSEFRDVSQQPPYSQTISQTYRVTGDIEALAIRMPGDQNPSFLSLKRFTEPYRAPEIAFRRSVEKGQTFKVSQVLLLDTVLDDTYYYVLQFDRSLDPTLPVYLPLNTELTTDDGKLSSDYFQIQRGSPQGPK